MSYSILIVDDSATTRAMIKRTIRMTDLPVANLYDAPDGKAALELITKRVNLILADLNMPEMDGFEMTRRLLAPRATRRSRRSSSPLRPMPRTLRGSSTSAVRAAKAVHT